MIEQDRYTLKGEELAHFIPAEKSEPVVATADVLIVTGDVDSIFRSFLAKLLPGHANTVGQNFPEAFALADFFRSDS